jgi:DNA-directed RNA polymerase specialized sigma24 family protein
MDSEGEISRIVAELKAGQRDAARPLWEHYHRRLLGLARAELGGLPRRVTDEEDVALSAFDSFCRGAERGRFPQLEDRHDLWQVLGMITARKAADLHQHHRRKKRGGGQVRGDSALLDADAEGTGLDGLAGDGPAPDLACAVAEECQRLLDSLPDNTLRLVALGKLEGYTNPELAERLGCSLATVGRKLERIRRIWKRLKNENE